MDPRACLEILGRAIRDHDCDAAKGHAEHACCAGGAHIPEALDGPSEECAKKLLSEAACDNRSAAAETISQVRCAANEELPAEAATAQSASRQADSCALSARPLAASGAGQVIDLETGKNESVGADMSEESLLRRFPDLVAPTTSADGGQEDLGDASAPPTQLIMRAVKLHEARVAVHRAYDGAFLCLLKGNGGGPQAVARTYPSIVARVTVRFQALSERARALAVALETASQTNSDVSEAAALVRKVQMLEQARLRLVAIHHVEQSQLVLPGSGDPSKCAETRNQLGSISEEIEELISELKHCAVELGEAEE